MSFKQFCPVIKVIRSRFEKLTLKDLPFITHDPVNVNDIDALKQHLVTLFPNLDLTKLQKAITIKCTENQIWVEKHCRQRWYAFQIRKCNDTCCRNPPILACNWLPDPILQDGLQHFKPFEDVYGTDTSESDHPSMN